MIGSGRAIGFFDNDERLKASSAVVLQTLYTLSDDQTEYQLKDRLSLMRGLGLALHDPVPNAKTIRLYREQLARAGAAEKLFARFEAPGDLSGRCPARERWR